MKANRKKLLKKLESVSLGLSKSEETQQSNCFAFKDGEVVTFNEEVCCRTQIDMDIEGSVVAEPLMKLLSKVSDDEVELTVVDGALAIKGADFRAKVNMSSEVELPSDSVDAPSDWHKLPEKFAESVETVRHCAGTDVASRFVLTCVHISTTFVEAGDNVRMCRYSLDTGFQKDTLISASSLVGFVGMDIKEFSETDDWIHFRTADGTIISCHQHIYTYPDASPFLEVEGGKAKLPDDIEGAIDKCEIFSKDNADENVVLVTIKKGQLILEGLGEYGDYKQRKEMKYNGEEAKFYIYPKMMLDILKRSNKCVIGKGRIKLTTDNYSYVACTCPVE